MAEGAKILHTDKEFTFKDLLDSRFLDEMEKSGFFDKLWKEKS
jgi:hypothetical protein